MIEKIKKDKLKFLTIIVAVIVVIAGVVVTAFNTGETYAESASDYECVLGSYKYVDLTDVESPPLYIQPYGYTCQLFTIKKAHESPSFSYGTHLSAESDIPKEDTACYKYLTEMGQTYLTHSIGGCFYAATKKQDNPSSNNPSNEDVYTIQLNANGGRNSDGMSTSTHSVNVGSNFIFPSASRMGYTLLGWSLSSSDTSAKYKVGDTITPTANITYYAVWGDGTNNDSTSTEACYFCNGNSSEYMWSSGQPSTLCTGGTWSKVNKTQAECKNTTEITPITPDTSSGTVIYYFKDKDLVYCYNSADSTGGWTARYDSQNGCNSVQVYTTNSDKWVYGTKDKCYILKSDLAGTSRPSSCSSGSGDTTETYTIKYDANGGTGAPADQTKTEGKELTLSNTKPTWSGYTFLGWNTDKSATTAKYQTGSSYTEDKSVTLYAIWKKNSEENNKADQEIDTNSKTGDALIIAVWAIGLGTLGYAVYYFMKRKNSL